MDDKMVTRVISVNLYIPQIIMNGFERSTKEAQIAADIRGQIESELGGVWNCVLGKSFGSHVLHMTKNYKFGKVYKYHVLLWKAGN